MSDNKITQAELQQIFGPEMPWEAYAYLFGNDGAGPTDDLATVRSKLSDMARSNAKQDRITKIELVLFLANGNQINGEAFCPESGGTAEHVAELYASMTHNPEAALARAREQWAEVCPDRPFPEKEFEAGGVTWVAERG
jgi:hypothetical protein